MTRRKVKASRAEAETPPAPAPTAARQRAAAQPAQPPQGAKTPAEQPAAPPGRAAASAPPARSKRRSIALSRLEGRIGYRFGDLTLAERALTHISGVRGPHNPGASYQRLEFLGDHVLGLVISDMLFRAFPRANEGELSRRLAELVRKDACADVAFALNLGEAIKLGGSEAKTGARRRPTILADVCESLIGAVFLDGGYAAAAEFIERFWRERMITPVRPLRDPKTLLQEWAQGRGLPAPVYREVARTGPQHSPEFRVAVELPNREPTEGVGRSKRAAEQTAAAAMLEREGLAADGGKRP